MGKIIRNGITYGGSSTRASNVSYDNSTSDLSSVTVQNAITELKDLFDNSEHITMTAVDELPEVEDAKDNVIYLVDTDENNIYEQWIVVDIDGEKSWISIGETEVDLSDYLKAEDAVGRFEYDVDGNILGEYFNDYKEVINEEMGEVTSPRNIARGIMSHVEGENNAAYAEAAHVEGISNKVGSYDTTSDSYTGGGAAMGHAEGMNNIVANVQSHAEGYNNKILGNQSHAEGANNISSAMTSHMEGSQNIDGGGTLSSQLPHEIISSLPTASADTMTKAYLVWDNMEKKYQEYVTLEDSDSGTYSWSELGFVSINVANNFIHTEGYSNLNISHNSHIEGQLNTIYSAPFSHAEGESNFIGNGSIDSHVEGKGNIVPMGSLQSHIEGLNNDYQGGGNTALHIEGIGNTGSAATGGTKAAHIEGSENSFTTGGSDSTHIEGIGNKVAYTKAVHIEGGNNTIGNNTQYTSVSGYNNIIAEGGIYHSNIKGTNNTVGQGHVALTIEGNGHIVPSGKSSYSINSNGSVSISGNDVGGHIEGYGHNINLNPNDSYQSVGGSYHIEGDGNRISYQINSLNTTNSPLLDDTHIEGGGHQVGYSPRAHIEGDGNIVTGYTAHVEGSGNRLYPYQESGYNIYTLGTANHIEGSSNTSYQGYYQHIEGSQNSLLLNINPGNNQVNHIEGYYNRVENSLQSFYYNHIEGYENKVSELEYGARQNHIEGSQNKLTSNITGFDDSVSIPKDAYDNHIEGCYNEVTGNRNHAEGYGNKMVGTYGHAEGQSNKVSGYYGHAEGYGCTVSDYEGHAEGYQTQATGTGAHAEGGSTISNNNYTHAEGSQTIASGVSAHAEGSYTTASGNYSHSAGYQTEAATQCSTVIGRYNKIDNSQSITSNLYDTAIDFTYLTADGVAELLGCTMKTSNYIDVENKSEVILYSRTGTGDSNESPFTAWAFYDVDKNLITDSYTKETSATDNTSVIKGNTVLNDFNKINGQSYEVHSQGIIIPENAKYFRFCFNRNYSPSIYAYVNQDDEHLFLIGNGYKTAYPENKEYRSNIFEVGNDYININGSLNINGSIYQDGDTLNSGTPHFVGTSIEWAVLSDDEKAEYEGGDIVFTDDNISGTVDQEIVEGSENPISSNAVYQALKEIVRPVAHASTPYTYWYCREYYDGRILIHYRRTWGETSLKAGEITKLYLDYAKEYETLDTKFIALIKRALVDNNNLVFMSIFKNDNDNVNAKTNTSIFQINKIGLSNSGTLEDIPTIWITTLGEDYGTDNAGGSFTIDFQIDTF